MKDSGKSMNLIFLFLKSIVVGFFMLVPGISGGTIAILLNIYNDLLFSVNNIFKTFKTSFTILFTAMVGGFIGLFLSTYVLTFAIKRYYFEIIFIFIGIMLSYTFSLFKKTSRKYLLRNIGKLYYSLE